MIENDSILESNLRGVEAVSDENSNDSNGLPEKGQLLKQFETAVVMGALDVEQVALNGSAVLAAERIETQSKDKRKDRDDAFIRELRRTNEFLERIDARIAELQAEIDVLEEQRREALRLAEEAFNRAIEADELLDVIADGISPEERKRLIDLLGAEAANASPDEIAVSLETMRNEGNVTGRDQTEHADELADQIERRKFEIDALQNGRDAHTDAQTPEEKAKIEAELSEFIYEEQSNTPELQPINLGL